jgi:hypothetical protein
MDACGTNFIYQTAPCESIFVRGGFSRVVLEGNDEKMNWFVAGPPIGARCFRQLWIFAWLAPAFRGSKFGRVYLALRPGAEVAPEAGEKCEWQ